MTLEIQSPAFLDIFGGDKYVRYNWLPMLFVYANNIKTEHGSRRLRLRVPFACKKIRVFPSVLGEAGEYRLVAILRGTP